MDNVTITSAQYVQVDSVNDTIKATIEGETVFVPIDTANRDYQAILDWVADGNTITDAS